MRIAVIGGGGGGLVSSWLLDPEHDVTLFEQDSRLGGHAHTVDVEVEGKPVAVDAGFEFFWEQKFPTLLRLLGLLGVPVRRYPARVTFEGPGRTTIMPPLQAGRPMWSACTPRAVLDLLGLYHAVSKGESLVRRRDPSVTVGQFLDGLRLPAAVREQFLLPILLAGWCVDPADFRTFLASDVLSYFPVQRPSQGLQPTHMEVEGGTRSYIEAAARQLQRTHVRLSTPVESVVEESGRIAVRTKTGETGTFDAVVLATNAAQAAGLLSGFTGAEEAGAALRGIRYAPTRIALHGDPRWMPRDRGRWSFVNIRSDGRHSHTTVWKPWRGPPVFKSWVTHTEVMPEPLYALVTYQHPWVDAAYFDTQRRIQALQGRQGVWFAGMYTQDIDCHESVVQSAVQVARALAPASPRLAALMGERPA